MTPESFFFQVFAKNSQIKNIFEEEKSLIAAAASEPEANERGSSLISRRLHYRGLQSLFLTKRKELWLSANGRFRMCSDMRKELWLCANGNILGCTVKWRKEQWLCTNEHSVDSDIFYVVISLSAGSKPYIITFISKSSVKL